MAFVVANIRFVFVFVFFLCLFVFVCLGFGLDCFVGFSLRFCLTLCLFVVCV